MEAYLAGKNDKWCTAVCGVTKDTMIEIYTKYARQDSALNHP